MTLLSAAVCSAALIAPAEAIDLKHSFKLGTVSQYEFIVSGEQQGMDVEMVAGWTQTVGKAGRRGGISMAVTEGAMSVWAGEQEIQGEEGIELTMTLDKFGMPSTISTEDDEIFFQAGQMLQYLPAKKVEVGSEFEIKWAEGGAEFIGTGKLEGIVKLDGKDRIKVHYEVEMTPAGETPASLVFDTWFKPDTLQAVLAKGDIEMDDGGFDIALTLKTKKK